MCMYVCIICSEKAIRLGYSWVRNNKYSDNKESESVVANTKQN